MSRQEVGFKTTSTADDYPFQGLSGPETHKIDRQTGTEKFLDIEYDKWKKWQSDKKATKSNR